jgi:hypothetical protein
MAEGGLHLRFQVGDAHHLDFLDQTFGRVFAAYILNSPG